MSWLIYLFSLMLLTACKNPYVIDAKGVEVEETSNAYHESYDDSDVDEYLEKPMVFEVDADGVDTSDPGTAGAEPKRSWLDTPDAYDKSLFRSPAMSTTDEVNIDAESDAERHDFDCP